MIGFLPLLLVVGIVALVVTVSRRSHRETPVAPRPPGEFRRGAELTLLAVSCVIATIGIAGLLTRGFDAMAGVPVARDVSGTARALAFTLIAGPLAAVSWWWRWRRPASADRDSPLWAGFLHAMSSLALLVWSLNGLNVASRWIAGRLDRGGLAAAIAWFAAWLGYRWVQRRSERRPTRLADVASVLGSATGLGLWMFGTTRALSGLGARALEHWSDLLWDGGSVWWRAALGWAVFAVGGGVIWWLHWVHDGARAAGSRFAHTVFVLSGIVAGAVLTLVGSGMALYDVLRRIAGAGGDLASARPSLGTAAALTVAGAIAWTYHHHALRARPVVVQRSAGLALSGIGLVAAATGLGIVVNAALGAVGTTLAGSGMRDLLCGGLSVFAVGLPLWVVMWRPGVQIRDPEQRHWAGRQIYLVLVFGASALTALVTALVIGYQVFEFLLRSTTEHGLLDRVRGALGLLTATVVVAAYHFPVWRRDRTIREREAPRPLRAVVLVAGPAVGGPELDELARAVREETGATLTVWTRADGGPAPPSAAQLTAALSGLDSARALVVPRDDGSIEVVPLTR